jgi:hypothetical protein
LKNDVENAGKNWRQIFDQTIAKIKSGGDKSLKTGQNESHSHSTSSDLGQLTNCRFQTRFHATWQDGTQTDPWWGQQPWAYVSGSFKGRVFTGQREYLNGTVKNRLTYVIEVDADRMSDIEMADYNIKIEVINPDWGPDDVWNLTGTSVVHKRDQEATGSLYFELAGSEVGESLDPACSVKSQAYAGARGPTVKKFSANDISFIEIQLSPSIPNVIPHKY